MCRAAVANPLYWETGWALRAWGALQERGGAREGPPKCGAAAYRQQPVQPGKGEW